MRLHSVNNEFVRIFTQSDENALSEIGSVSDFIVSLIFFFYLSTKEIITQSVRLVQQVICIDTECITKAVEILTNRIS